MTSNADEFWDEIAPKYRKLKRLCPMTPEEAETAFDEAPEIPITLKEIQQIVDGVVEDETPEWEPEASEWSPDENVDCVNDEMFAVFRDEGEPDPETDAKEEELRNRMLNDETTEHQNGLDGGATPSGGGGKDG